MQTFIFFGISPIIFLLFLISCNSTKKPVKKVDTVETEKIDSAVQKEVEPEPVKVKEKPKAPKKSIWENVYVNLRKTPCSGDCPVYEAAVLKDGTVIYKGIESVLVKGKRTFKLSDEAFEKLKQMFAKKLSNKKFSK